MSKPPASRRAVRATAAMPVVALWLVGGPILASELAPDRALLDAFGQVCSSVQDFDSMVARAPAAGWTTVPPGSNAKADRVRNGFAESREDRRVTARQFEQRIAGRHLLLSLRRSEFTAGPAAGFGENNCQIGELEPGPPIATPIAQAWAGRAPDEEWQNEDGVRGSFWGGFAWGAGVLVDVVYVPVGAPSAGHSGLHGVYLNARAYAESR